MPRRVLHAMDVDCTEFMFYQYLPVKLAGEAEPTKLEPRLRCFAGLIGAALCDYVGMRGIDAFVGANVYVTAKHGYESPTALQNRPGWHCDGFLTDDFNYIWSDRTPTVFNYSEFRLTRDDTVSLAEMERQADPLKNHVFEPGALIQLDQYVVHRVGVPDRAGNRTFLKVSISTDIYDLRGNAKNYDLDYDWPVRERALTRNVPQRLTDHD